MSKFQGVIVPIVTPFNRDDAQTINYEAGDAAEAERLQAEIEPIRDVLHLGSTPQTLKRSLELAGYEVGPARFPVTEVADGIDEKCIAMLDHYGIAHK